MAGYPSLAGLEVPPVIRSPRSLGYRARVKLVVRKTRDGVAAGLYLPQSHRVTDVSSCAVHPQAINRVVRYLKEQILRLRIQPYNETNDGGDLRYLDLRFSFSRRELGITLVTRRAEFRQGRELARALMRRFSFVHGVVQNINETRGNVIWGKRFRLLAGRNSILEQIGFLSLKFPAGVFSQANPVVARRLYQAAQNLAGLEGKENVLDLYCGVGPLSLHLATTASSVWGIDDYALSVATAKQNARMNGFHNCRFLVGDAAEMICEVAGRLRGIDLISVNPPRKGLRPEALKAILSARARKILYVSCEPETLARDMDWLVVNGYRPVSVHPFDMLPQTGEVETLALLAAV